MQFLQARTSRAEDHPLLLAQSQEKFVECKDANAPK